ncbi:uncharacterized protein LOC143902160 isoform X2 [Temnothorax americanus]|uniref:uncharacterized protein LOC143902160 isoform X2 n=1 Tax=Temnothorax americanus TaxID=1964332 RepID=UPI0040680FF2
MYEIFCLLHNMFTVIQFDEKSDADLAVVSSTWLTPRKREVFWPPYKNTSSYNKALKKHEQPDEKKWTLYEVQKIFYETDNIDVAHNKAKVAEFTSDLNTDLEGDNTIKRQRHPPRRLYDNNSDDSTEESCAISKFDRPPPIKKNFLNRSSENNVSTLNILDEEDSSECGNNIPSNSWSNSTSRSNSTLNRILNNNELDEKDSSECGNNTPSNSRSNSISRSNSTSRWNSTLNRILNNNELDEKALNKQIVDTLITIKEQNNQILAYIRKAPQAKGAVIFSVPENLPVNLPLQTDESVDLLETFITDQDNSHNLTQLNLRQKVLTIKPLKIQ